MNLESWKHILIGSFSTCLWSYTWACCFVFPRTVARGLNKQALTPTTGKGKQQLPGAWTRDAGVQTGASLVQSTSLRLRKPLWEASAHSSDIGVTPPSPNGPGFPATRRLTAQGHLFVQPGMLSQFPTKLNPAKSNELFFPPTFLLLWLNHSS